MAKQTPPKRRRAATVERVLAAAEKLFLEKGFRAASLHEIAAEAGYTTGAIYSSFSGKDDLFLAVYRRKAEEQQESLRAALASATSAEDVPEALTVAMNGLEPAWYAAIFEFMSYAARDDRLRHETADIYRGGPVLLADLLAEYASGSPLPLDRLAPILVGLLRGLAWTWFVDPEAADVGLFSDAVAVLLGASQSAQSGRS